MRASLAIGTADEREAAQQRTVQQRRRRRPAPGARLGTLLFGLALGAGPAEALNFVVNSTGNQVDAAPGDGVCATAGAVCTLRAAILEANAPPVPTPSASPSGSDPTRLT